MHEVQEPSPGTALMSIPQVATYMGVCRAHVYKLINKGLPVIRLGRRVLVNPTSLQQWLADQEHQSHHL
jgi:excisionase family DNA binding protein